MDLNKCIISYQELVIRISLTDMTCNSYANLDTEPYKVNASIIKVPKYFCFMVFKFIARKYLDENENFG